MYILFYIIMQMYIVHFSRSMICVHFSTQWQSIDICYVKLHIILLYLSLLILGTVVAIDIACGHGHWETI